MYAALRLLLRNFKASLDREFLVIQLAMPIFIIYVAGFALTPVIKPLEFGTTTVSYEYFLVSGALAMTVMSGSMLGGTMLWSDRRYGMFEQILVGPFARIDYTLSMVLCVILFGLAGSAIVSLVALPIFHPSTISLFGVLQTIVALTAGAMLFGALSLSIAARAKSSEVYAASMNLLLLIFMFLSSVLYPAENIPPALKIIFYLNPLTYTADWVRWALLQIPNPLLQIEQSLLVLEAFLSQLLVVSIFKKIQK